MNPRDLAKAMKKLGIKQEEIPAVEVIIKTTEKELVISSPQVTKVNMAGQETFQITGQVQERSLNKEPEIKEEDIQTVMELAKVDKETALNAIKKNGGDLARTIMELTR